MKATEFVKKHGIKAVIHDFGNYLKDANIGTIAGLTHENEYFEVDGDELKRLVESHDLVESYGGLTESRIKQAINGNKRLLQAIADVEACQ